MKTVIAVLATAAISVGGAHAYDAAVTPAQIQALNARVTVLEQFKRQCLQANQVHLTENSQGVMVWGIGAPSTHAATFYGAIKDTTRVPYACLGR
jgi:hypothetical protein